MRKKSLKKEIVGKTLTFGVYCFLPTIKCVSEGQYKASKLVRHNSSKKHNMTIFGGMAIGFCIGFPVNILISPVWVPLSAVMIARNKQI